MLDDTKARLRFGKLNLQAVVSLTKQTVRIRAQTKGLAILKESVMNYDDADKHVLAVRDKLKIYDKNVKNCRDIWRAIRIADVTSANLQEHLERIQQAEHDLARAHGKYNIARRAALKALRDGVPDLDMRNVTSLLGEKFSDVLLKLLRRNLKEAFALLK
jgi:hypothetical protein